MTRWGIVSTVKAPLPAILDFAAWHLELGAHRLFIYLDDDVPDTLQVLKDHPRIRALHTDAAWWDKRNGRPGKHQVRQVRNARHANNRKPDTDWLLHIDVDEFLLASHPVDDILSALPDDALCARIRPVEALAPGDGVSAGETAFKAFHLDHAARNAAARACFPTWGRYLSGGFLSHVAGKMAFRTGLGGLKPRIHNVELDGESNPGQVELTGIELGHFHAADWDHFLALYRFRMAQGSYRSELKPPVRQPGAVTIHELFKMIEAEGGEDALAMFYGEVCTASADLCARLDRQGLLRRHRMNLPDLRAKHFPGL